MAKSVTTPNILWKIANFTSVHKKMSPIIIFMGLKFHLNYSKYMESGVAKLQLILECQNVSQALSSWQFEISAYVLHTSGSRHLPKSGKYDLSHNECCVWSDFVSSVYKSVGQINDLTFLIMITISGNFEIIFSSKQSSDETNQMTPCTRSLREDIGSLLNNDECSDFILKCGYKSFPVHKAILSARSEFFAGMFRCGMKEASENSSKIENIEPDILELVLDYMYTGVLPQMPIDILQKVYAAADRLIVEPLKIKCHFLFIDNFTTESEENSELEESSEEETKSKQPGLDEQPEATENVENDSRERKMLKDLFMTREWRLFSEEFPHKAHEMCKPFFLPSP